MRGPDRPATPAAVLAAPTGEIAAAGDRLRGAAEAAVARARTLGRPVLAWTSSEAPPLDPLDLLTRGGLRHRDPVLFARPGEGFSLLGIGRAWEFTADAQDRFARSRQASDVVLREAVSEAAAIEPSGAGDPARPARGAGPVLLGGFAFSTAKDAGSPWAGFPAAMLALPRLLITGAGASSRVTLSVLVHPDGSMAGLEAGIAEALGLLGEALEPGGAEGGAGDGVREPAGLSVEELPPAETWMAEVSSATRAVRAGALRKVVAARAVRVRGIGGDPIGTLRRLRAGYPSCTLFAVVRAGGWFVGATPERLVRVSDGGVSAMALAGSAPRGRTEEEDRRLGEGLLISPKDRVEHEVVVETLRDALAELCEDLTVAPAPSLLRVSNVQHLCTPITARVRGRATVLDLVERLHPTPAVGGVPRDDALEWIRLHEGIDRGWYAGPVGWMDPTGAGEFAVALRCALLQRDEAVLFTGCGIMADSDPYEEYAESRLKLRPMLSALGANGGNGPAPERAGS